MAKRFMADKYVNFFLILLIILYILLIFVNVALSDLLTNEELEELTGLLYFELVILILF